MDWPFLPPVSKDKQDKSLSRHKTPIKTQDSYQDTRRTYQDTRRAYQDTRQKPIKSQDAYQDTRLLSRHKTSLSRHKTPIKTQDKSLSSHKTKAYQDSRQKIKVKTFQDFVDDRYITYTQLYIVPLFAFCRTMLVYM